MINAVHYPQAQEDDHSAHPQANAHSPYGGKHANHREVGWTLMNLCANIHIDILHQAHCRKH